MKTNLKRKNYYLDEKKIRRVRTILGAKTETEAIDAALNLVVFRKEILKSLEKVAGQGWSRKGFLVAKHLIDTDLYIDLIQSGTTLPFIRELYDKDAPGHLLQFHRSSRIACWRPISCGEKARRNIIPSLRESRSSCNSRSQPLEE